MRSLFILIAVMVIGALLAAAIGLAVTSFAAGVAYMVVVSVALNTWARSRA